MQYTAPVPHQPTTGRRRRWVWTSAVACAVIVLAAVLWVTGGLEEKPKQPVKSPGKAVDVKRFALTVHDVRAGTADSALGGGNERFLIVRMRVVNKSEQTARLGGTGLQDGVVARTKDGKWVKPDQVTGVAAGAKTDAAQPDLPVEASVMWKLGTAAPPETFTFGLREWEYDHGFTDSEYTWRVQAEGGELAARFTLPVGTGTP
ncbi:DUF4352 domain-containing protein [Actinomadura sp. WMMB 499]|uniref:DUF4352 domain-containing protein n=1 Tax=Actinomadura sp. WMMB 499 TaxID=1219491 RepID=UPI001244D9D9|nr:DUF4352 domain-containing protein [Actinomadura sp. WMMB 499]QFG22097.1 DUF4352 domain-containing protein [Actinomadura sp. WMMB 499]